MGIRYYINRRTSLRVLSKIIYFFDWSSQKTFKKNHEKYKKLYHEYKQRRVDYSKWVLPMWREYTEEIEKDFLSTFKYSFLRHPIIRKAVFVNENIKLQKIQLAYITDVLGKQKLAKILPENTVGNPTISSFRYRTSHNSIHHLHHLARFSKETHSNLERVRSVTEWGGGYGNLAKIFLRINPNVTYTIIDLPVFSFIQALYLSTIFGNKKVQLITDTHQSIQKGKINIIPLNEKVLENIARTKTDIFVSTWALSESTEYAQRYVESSSFFNADSLLLAHQENSQEVPHAESITKRLGTYEIIYHKKIPLLKNNYYLFCKRK